LVMVGCGGAVEEGDSDDSIGSVQQAASTDPNQNLFAIRGSNSYGVVVNPLGNNTVACSDGIRRAECSLGRINLAGTGLSSAAQAALRTRIANEAIGEAVSSVIVKGTLARAYDPFGLPLGFWEIRVTAAWTAPTARSHETAFNYVQTAPTSAGFQTVLGVNGEMSGLISLPINARMRWVGPHGERPTTNVPAGSIVTITAARPAPGYPTTGWNRFFDVDIDQLFTRVSG